MKVGIITILFIIIFNLVALGISYLFDVDYGIVLAGVAIGVVSNIAAQLGFGEDDQ